MSDKVLSMSGLNFTYNESEHCGTCGQGQCHNILKCNKDGQEYFVHVCTIPCSNTFDIVITSMEDSKITPEYLMQLSDTEAARYLFDRFGFECA